MSVFMASQLNTRLKGFGAIRTFEVLSGSMRIQVVIVDTLTLKSKTRRIKIKIVVVNFKVHLLLHPSKLQTYGRSSE